MKMIPSILDSVSYIPATENITKYWNSLAFYVTCDYYTEGCAILYALRFSHLYDESCEHKDDKPFFKIPYKPLKVPNVISIVSTQNMEDKPRSVGGMGWG